MNTAYIYDQMAIAGYPAPAWAWQIGIHPSLYEEQRHLDAEVSVSMEYLANIYELALEGTEYLCHDEGTADQLREVLGPLGLLSLASAGPVSYDSGEIPDSVALAPMVSNPIQAPTGASFLQLAAPKKIAGTIAVDMLERSTVKRILEISPNSSKLCVIAAIQSSKVSLNSLNSRLLGDQEAYQDSDMAEEVSEIISESVKLIRENVPTAHHFYQTAKAARACGLVKLRWDDLANQSLDQFKLEVRRVVLSDPQSALTFLHLNLPNALLSAGKSYHEQDRVIKSAKDPEKANKEARVQELRKKFKARAKEYELRIRALKSGRSTIDVGARAKDPHKKLVYLVGARTMMECLEIKEGPSVDLKTTATRLLGRINAKLKSLDYPPQIESDSGLLEEERISKRLVVKANLGPTHQGWFPDEYARGVLAAESWALEDAIAESKLVYYGPRHVEVLHRVKKHVVTRPTTIYKGTVLSSRLPHPKPEIAQEPEVVAEVTAVPSTLAAAEVATPLGLDFLSAQFAAAAESKRSKQEYKEFVNTMEAWQLVTIHLNHGEDPDIKGSNDDKIRIALQASTVKNADLTEKGLRSLRRSTVSLMHRSQSKLIAPTEADVEVSEDLVR
jgi:hypothetical protein